MLAGDLQVAARAAEKLAQSVAATRDADRGRSKGEVRERIFEPLKRFESAFGGLLRDRLHADDARAKMLQWAGEHAALDATEELAFQSASYKVMGVYPAHPFREDMP